MRRSLLLIGAVAVVASCAVLVSAASGSSGSGQARWVIIDLGTLGGKSATAVDINERGQIVGQSDTGKLADGGPVGRAFLWQDGKMRALPIGYGEAATDASALNDRGQVVGTWSETNHGDFSGPVLWPKGLNGREVLLDYESACDGSPTWTMAGINERGASVGTFAAEDVETGGSCQYAFFFDGMIGVVIGTSAVALNDRDQVLGVSDFGKSKGSHAVLRRPGGRMMDLGAFDPVGLNNRAQVVGTRGSRAVVWQQGKVTDLGSLGGKVTTPTAINESGQVVGYSGTGRGQTHAFVWQNGRMTDLGTLSSGKNSSAVAINQRGQVIGTSSSASGWGHGFIWQDGKMTDLGTLPGGNSSTATAINNRGQIVGWATTKSGARLAVLWTPRSG